MVHTIQVVENKDVPSEMICRLKSSWAISFLFHTQKSIYGLIVYYTTELDSKCYGLRHYIVDIHLIHEMGSSKEITTTAKRILERLGIHSISSSFVKI